MVITHLNLWIVQCDMNLCSTYQQPFPHQSFNLIPNPLSQRNSISGCQVRIMFMSINRLITSIIVVIIYSYSYISSISGCISWSLPSFLPSTVVLGINLIRRRNSPPGINIKSAHVYINKQVHAGQTVDTNWLII